MFSKVAYTTATRAFRAPSANVLRGVRMNSTQAGPGPFGADRKATMMWFTKAAAASAILGYGISNYVLTDDRMAPVYKSVAEVASSLKKKAEEMGLELPFTVVHAFSTADHGLHPPHYPWEHYKPWKTYDHAA